jgi:hypothetical protein
MCLSIYHECGGRVDNTKKLVTEYHSPKIQFILFNLFSAHGQRFKSRLGCVRMETFPCELVTRAMPHVSNFSE